MEIGNRSGKTGRRMMPIWAFCLFVGAMFIFSSEASAFQYTIKCPDQNAKVNFYGIALDANGNPGIGYICGTGALNSGGNVLKFAHWDGSSWDTKTVDSNCINWDVSVAYNQKTGHPGIVYNYGGKLAYYDSSRGWVTEQVTARPAGYRGSLAYDKDGNPTIALREGSGKNVGLKLATRDSQTGAWSFQMVDNGAANGYPSLAYDSTGTRPAITYHTTTTSGKSITYSIKCAWYDSSNWVIRTIASSPNPFAYRTYLNLMTSVAFDVNDRPAVEYICAAPDKLTVDMKIAHWTDAGWSTEFVVNEGSICNPGKPSLIYAGGIPYICYCSNPANENAKIKLAYKNGDRYATELVDILTLDYGTFSTTMGVKASGNVITPIVVYVDEADSNRLHCAFG